MQVLQHFHQHLSTLFIGLSPHKIASFLVPLCYLWFFYVCLAKLHAAVLGLLWFYHPYIFPCLFLFISYYKNELFELIQSFEPLFPYVDAVRTCLLRVLRLYWNL